MMQPRTNAVAAEQVNYNSGFPLYARHHALSEFNFQVVPHWHPDLEFLKVTTGEMSVFVNGKNLLIQAGDGIFINSNRMNFSYTSLNTVAEFTAVIFNLRMFADATPFTQEYFQHYFSTATQDYILLSHETDWQNQVLLSIEDIYNSVSTAPPFALLGKISNITNSIIPYLKVKERPIDSRLHQTLWSMVSFIHDNYAQPIRVEDIADFAHVSRTQVFSLFNQLLNISPNEYLNNVRLNNALYALRDTNSTITDIAFDTGFSSSSYFVQKFSKHFKTTPAAYRKKYRNNNQHTVNFTD
ncbi:MAG: AraC family transcriptional regulator [Weissella confusa]|jgi:AraC-type DNA-binding domain-containing proteins|nr:AraC family transcriptional regulator [Weissella confusa]